MQNKKDPEQHTPIDPHLDTPAEANREKHINFREMEDESTRRSGSDYVDDFAEERRKEWKQGLADGKKARERGD